LRLRAWGWVAESLGLRVERKRQFGVESLGLAAGGDRGPERFRELTAKTLRAGSLRLGAWGWVAESLGLCD
jgi:hypothetical protein